MVWNSGSQTFQSWDPPFITTAYDDPLNFNQLTPATRLLL